MKTITLLSVMACLLFDLFGTKSSVGGPLTDLLIAFLTMLAVGIYEAYSEKRGPLGWIVSIIAALIGGFIGIWLFGLTLESIMTQIHFQGKLATSHHPLRYVASASIPIFTVVGSWIVLQVANRFRKTSVHSA